MKLKTPDLKYGLLLVIFLFSLLCQGQNAMAQYDTVWTRMTEASIKQVAFHPNSQLIATGNNSAYVSIWDVFSGNELKRFTGASSNLFLQFTGNGKYLAFGGGSDQGGVKIIDFESQQDYRMLVCPTNSAAFINDSNLIVIGGRKDIRIWDFQKNEVVKYIDSIVQPDFGGSLYELYKIVYSHIDNNLIYTATDGKLRFYNLTKGIIEYTYNAGYGEIAISNDSKYIAFKTGVSGSAIQIMDVETKQIVKSISGSPSGINSIVFSPDGKYLAIAYDYAGACKIWDLETEKIAYDFKLGTHQNVAFSKNNQYLITNIAQMLILYNNPVNSVNNLDNNFDILYPNPTNQSLTIQINLPKSDNVTINLLSLDGQLIRNIFDGFLDSGEHKIQTETTGIASGNYFIVIQSGTFSKTFKLIIEK